MKIQTVQGIVTARAEDLDDIQYLLSYKDKYHRGIGGPRIGAGRPRKLDIEAVDVTSVKKGEWKYRTCKLCNKSFCIGSGLTKHMRATHGIKKEQKPRGSTPCPECSGMFKGLKGLSFHRWKAHGVKSSKHDYYKNWRIEKAKRDARVVLHPTHENSTVEDTQSVPSFAH